MKKSLFIAEKPSVAREFAAALKENMSGHDGYQESEHYVVTWCVGHLVTMSYPEKYDEAYKKWRLDTLPFLPENFLYEIIPAASKQFNIVKGLLNREDVGTIFVCTDSGREGEYIYRLVAQEAGVKDKVQKRVWIDSQTEEEIIRGIKEAKLLSEYDDLAASAYLRAKEDYLMGINFSRVLSLKYAGSINNYLGGKYLPVSVGRVMTCVLGMVVRREREIRKFVKQPFYKVMGSFSKDEIRIPGEWRVIPGSIYEQSPYLYKDCGFTKEETAKELISKLSEVQPAEALLSRVEKKKEKKNAPLLYNLAELQNDCSRIFKISPDKTLDIIQSLYEKKLVTYPRTDARVLSSAVAKEIDKNIRGLTGYAPLAAFAKEVLDNGSYKGIADTRYTNDKLITDHYAVIPTGKGLNALGSIGKTEADVYKLIAIRFLSIFYPPAEYQKINLEIDVLTERFFASSKQLLFEGWLKVRKVFSAKEDKEDDDSGTASGDLAGLKKGDILKVDSYSVKEGETTPPKRYTSGSMILAMENAGQLIEDEDLRAQIKGSGIGTSATRAEILKKLVNIKYLSINSKTQVILPTQRGEMVYDVVDSSIRSLLNAELTASWEKGLSYVAEGSVTTEEYMEKLSNFIRKHTEKVKQLNNAGMMKARYDASAQYYKKAKSSRKSKETPQQ